MKIKGIDIGPIMPRRGYNICPRCGSRADVTGQLHLGLKGSSWYVLCPTPYCRYKRPYPPDGPPCPKCDAPMVLRCLYDRNVWACSEYRRTGCRGIQEPGSLRIPRRRPLEELADDDEFPRSRRERRLTRELWPA